MTIGTVSGIQIATLVAAFVAALSGLVGVVWVAKFTQQAEHGKWQRDLRIRLYSTCSEVGDSLQNHLLDFDLTPGVRDFGAMEPILVEKGRALDDLLRKMSSSVADVQTFGSTRVAACAGIMLSRFAVAVSSACSGSEIAWVEEARVMAYADLVRFRDAVRKSLGISDD
jgi:hypothetical protein